jgi:two-component system nitrate/nitrite response regulator NarL
LAASSTSVEDDAALPLSAESAIAVLIVTDVRLHRDGLAETLQRQPTVRVLGTAARPDDAMAQARSLVPDVILVDMVMRDDLQVVRALARDLPEARILALSVNETEEEVISCVEAGAAGCVAREASLDEVLAALEAIARGEVLCSPLMTAAVFKRVRALAGGRLGGLGSPLTPRELEIVALIDEGLSNKQIACMLSIETATVKNHIHNILEKLHVTRRGEAAAAVRHSNAIKHSYDCVAALMLLHALDEPFGLVLSVPWN